MSSLLLCFKGISFSHLFKHSLKLGVFVIIGLTIWLYASSGLKQWRPTINRGITPSISKCSAKADERGYHQKVVAYSLYGEPIQNERYFDTLVNTSRTFPSKYPGWTIRIYHNYTYGTNSREILDTYFGESSQVAGHVDLCYVSELMEASSTSHQQDSFEMTWRFFPLLDELVDVFASRDGDSFIYQRELDAVDEWLASDLTFHSMRDNIYHCIPMLGGMWGVKLHQRADITAVSLSMFSRSSQSKRYNFDQELLRDFIWPLAKHSVMAHDSYCCARFRPPSGSASVLKPFPTRRIGTQFVGQVGSSLEPEKCPMECRPRDHQDWEFC